MAILKVERTRHFEAPAEKLWAAMADSDLGAELGNTFADKGFVEVVIDVHARAPQKSACLPWS